MRSAVGIATILLLVSCGRGGDGSEPGPDRPSGDAPVARQAPAPKQPTARVYLETSDGGEISVEVEVVRNQRERSRGLMYRQHLPPGHGMLFIFDEQEVQHFWMKNTLIPLDMIFIDERMKIAGIVENAEPRTTTSRFIDAPSIYVLEVNGGWSADNGVAAGAVVRFENVEP